MKMEIRIKFIGRRFLYCFPPSFRTKLKNLYYDLAIPLHNLRYRVIYGMEDFFDYISLETTTHCNLRCKFCPNNKYERGLFKNKKLMNEKLFKKIISELSEINYCGQLLFHFYGEPLTDERLPDLVKYAREKLPKAELQVNTNGFLLTIPLYRKLINSGLDFFYITQYGRSAPPRIKELFSYLRKSSEKYTKIKYRVLGESIALSNRGGEINIKNPVDYERPICAYPRNIVHVDYEGNVVLCCNDYHSSVKFGNLNNEKLLEIWNKPSYRRLRKELKKKIFKLPICKKCVGLE